MSDQNGNERRRIVITGMGAVSPLGVGVAANWKALMESRSGIGLNTRFDTTDFACKIAGLVPGPLIDAAKLML